MSLSSATETSSDNSAATAILPSLNSQTGGQIASKYNGVMLVWSYSSTPTGGKVTLKKGSTTILEIDIIAGGPGFIPIDGFSSELNGSLSATIAPGGSGVVGKVSLSAKRA